MIHLLWIALGGGAGAVCRYSLSKYASGIWFGVFPLGTFLVNLIGCFLLGFVSVVFSRIVMPAHLKGVVSIGFLGAFTTFSTYSVETVSLLQEGEWRLGAINLLASTAGGLIMAVAGMWAARGAFSL